MTDKTRSEDRKPYSKPEIARYPLRAEEAVLGFCKLDGGAGPVGNCAMAGVANCSSPGS